MTESLAEYMAGTYDTEISQQEEPQRFVIDTPDKASWALRKIAQMEAKKKAAQEQADAETMRVKTWLAEQTVDCDKQIAWFEFMLRPFAESALQGEKKRSLTLPAGTIGFRSGQPHFDVNEIELLGYIKERAPGYVKIKESVDWSRFKKEMALQPVNGKAVTKDGEIIPGIVASDAEDTFYVKTGGK